MKRKNLLILNLVVLVSCLTPQQKLERLTKKYPELLSKDTLLIKGDSIYTEKKIVERDTLIKLIDKYCDTTYVNRTIIKRIKDKCNPSDSIIVDSSDFFIKAVYSNGYLKLVYEKPSKEVVVNTVTMEKEDPWFKPLLGYCIFATVIMFILLLLLWKSLK